LDLKVSFDSFIVTECIRDGFSPFYSITEAVVSTLNSKASVIATATSRASSVFASLFSFLHPQGCYGYSGNYKKIKDCFLHFKKIVINFC